MWGRRPPTRARHRCRPCDLEHQGGAGTVRPDGAPLASGAGPHRFPSVRARSVLRHGLAVLFLAVVPGAADAQGERAADSVRAKEIHDRAISDLQAARYDSAIVRFREAIRIRATIGDSVGLARSLNSIGTANFQVGQYELAIDRFVSSLAIRRALADSAGMARVLTNLGATYQDLNQTTRALETVREAVALAERGGDRLVLAYALTTLAALTSEQGDQPGAMALIGRARELYRPSQGLGTVQDSIEGWRFTTRPLGLALVRSGAADRGLPMLEALVDSMAATPGATRGEAWARITLGEAYATLGRLDDARTQYERGLAITRPSSQRPLALQALRDLGDVETRAGRPAVALAHLHGYLALRDTLFSEVALQRLASAESRLEMDRLVEAGRSQEARIARQRVIAALGAVILVLAGIAVALLVHYNRLGHRREAELARTNAELRTALDDVRTLSGLIPICANCKNVRDDRGYWEAVETYVTNRSDAMFSHSICPNCGPKLYGDEWHQHTGEAPHP